MYMFLMLISKDNLYFIQTAFELIDISAFNIVYGFLAMKKSNS